MRKTASIDYHPDRNAHKSRYIPASALRDDSHRSVSHRSTFGSNKYSRMSSLTLRRMNNTPSRNELSLYYYIIIVMIGTVSSAHFTEMWPFTSWNDTPQVEGHTGIDKSHRFVELHTPCRCWNTTDETNNIETECNCHGTTIREVPKNLDHHVNRITLSDCGLEHLSFGRLQQYRDTLNDFVVDKANHLVSIAEDAFQSLLHLQRIYIRHAPLLTILPRNLFSIYLPKLRILHIVSSGLMEFPYLGELRSDSIFHTIDLKGNKISSIPPSSVQLRAEELTIEHNLLEYVDAAAFNGSQISRLNFKGNRRLSRLHLNAFEGLASLRTIDLSETSITELPTKGLSEVEVLRLQDTETLKVIPSVYDFQSLKEAWLTYPCHCCAFQFPATHDPEKHERHRSYLGEMQKKYCTDDGHIKEQYATLSASPNVNRRLKSTLRQRRFIQTKTYHDASTDITYRVNASINQPVLFDIDHESDFRSGFGLSLEVSSEGSADGTQTDWYENDLGVFHSQSISPSPNLINSYFCGNLSKIHISPLTSPCEDIMGTPWLRGAVWIVVLASVIGNLAVILVLMSSRFRITVTKLLMVNLAVADLTMGMYLLLIAAMDLHSIGTYFNHAIDWQRGRGCNIAGFLTVFASELSIFTLVVITCERWYTITYAIHLNRRLRVSSAVKIMAIGWAYATIMASLPLLGVSGFSSTSICLPMENRNIVDTIYLYALLATKGLAFLIICVCYGHMYHTISDDILASHYDTTVAKRMALLIFTDFSCWAPIAFFGVTAISGYPLIDVTRAKILLVFFYPLNACTNPYLYAVLTKQYRRDLFVLLNRYGIYTKRIDQKKFIFSVRWNVANHPGSGVPPTLSNPKRQSMPAANSQTKVQNYTSSHAEISRDESIASVRCYGKAPNASEHDSWLELIPPSTASQDVPRKVTKNDKSRRNSPEQQRLRRSSMLRKSGHCETGTWNI